MDTQNWPKNEWEDIYHGLQEISRKMENIMINCVDDIDAKRFAQDCYDDIETWMDNCARKGNFKVETLDLTSSKKPVKSAMPGKEKGIRAIMDEYGCSWEEAEEIMNEQIDSGCHSESKKKTKKPEEKKPTKKIEQTRRARNTESLNNLYGKMF